MHKDIKYLELLSRSFPNIQAASTEIINLEAIMNLPKGTEHFVTDLHGEHESFHHLLRNASGAIKSKVDELFASTMTDQERTDLCILIYYPDKRVKFLTRTQELTPEWYTTNIISMMKVLEVVSSKYTRSKVRKALPREYSYIIQELLHESLEKENKRAYIYSIIDTIISTNIADNFIIALARVIQQLAIDSLHIIGDIYDRGAGAHIIMDTLCSYHNCDIQWGNHDIIWMGAASGSAACMLNVLRVSLRYANLETLEDGYGINLLPLATFAMEYYEKDPCKYFKPKVDPDSKLYSHKQQRLIAQMHKAIAVIQFKVEGDLIKRRPEFKMDDRLLLDKIDFEKKTITIDSVEYDLRDSEFPTIDPQNPYALTPDEEEVVNRLVHNFKNNTNLEKHIRCMYAKGSLYLVSNSNLIYHGSLPLNEDGTFKSVEILGAQYSGKPLLDRIDQIARLAYFEERDSLLKEYAQDFMWYLWCGPDSPSFDKKKMATFERYFIADKVTHKEEKGAYYILKEQKEVCVNILNEFGITDECSHIINGHIPVKTLKGESPIKAEGKLLVIDGGYAKAYQTETGIAGYTLLYNAFGLILVQHEPFESTEKAITEGVDIISQRNIIEYIKERTLIKDTDKGKILKKQADDLQALLVAFRTGAIRERN